jgi:copper chaperone CopZ
VTCAHAVRVAIRKIDGVESVDVSLERAAADVQLRAGNRVTLPQLRQIIKNNGFATREATVTAVGTLVERGGKPAVDVADINTVWLLVADPKRQAAYDSAVRRLATRQAGSIQIVGVVPAPKDTAEPEQIQVQSVDSVTK